MTDATPPSPQNLPPTAGWYPDDNGEVRYFDGGAWTEHVKTRLSPPQRSAVLDREVQTFLMQTAGTGVLVHRGEFEASVAITPKINHLLHFLIGVFTCGAWWLVWLILAISAKPTRRMLRVDEWGNANWSAG